MTGSRGSRDDSTPASRLSRYKKLINEMRARYHADGKKTAYPTISNQALWAAGSECLNDTTLPDTIATSRVRSEYRMLAERAIPKDSEHIPERAGHKRAIQASLTYLA